MSIYTLSKIPRSAEVIVEREDGANGSPVAIVQGRGGEARAWKQGWWWLAGTTMKHSYHSSFDEAVATACLLVAHPAERGKGGA